MPINANPDGSEFLTTAEAAARLGVTRYTLRGWINNGTLPAERIGRQRFVHLAHAERARDLTHVGEVVPIWRQEPVRGTAVARAARSGRMESGRVSRGG